MHDALGRHVRLTPESGHLVAAQKRSLWPKADILVIGGASYRIPA